MVAPVIKRAMRWMRTSPAIVPMLAAVLLPTMLHAANFSISSFDRSGRIAWTNTFTNGVCAVEAAKGVAGPWTGRQNFYTTSVVTQTRLTLPPSNQFFRLRAVDISATAQGFTNLVESYGVLETIAGNGFGGTDGMNYWRAAYEGGFATNAALSRPHFAMTDAVGNVFIVDKDSHSVLKVTQDGRIHTVAGTHVGGDNGDGPAPGINTRLNFPNGLFVRSDGTVYVLDTGNGKVRRLDTNGTMTTLFTVSAGINGGRGLWVSADESLTYFCSGTDLRKRVPGNITTLNNNFNDLGNIALALDGNIVATDRGDNKVFLVDATGGNQGGRSRLFGDGSTNTVVSGTRAFTNGLYGVRGVWPTPTGGYLLATHAGSQVLYVDPAGIVRVFVAGQAGGAHSGDGRWFYSPGLKITEARSVAMDHEGNILIVENDFGYVRRIQFRRL